MMQDENKRPDDELLSSTETADDALSAFEHVTSPSDTVAKKRLAANTRLLIAVTAVVAVLAILLAVLLPLLSEGTGDSSASSQAVSKPEEIYPLYDRTDDKIETIVQAIAIKNPDDQYTIRYNKADRQYHIDGYADISLATSGIEELVSIATVLNGYDKIKSVEKLSDFGLEKPQITVDIAYHDNTNITLLIGNETPDYTGYYAKLKDSNEVVMINADTVSYFQLKKGQYVERTLLAAPSAKKDDANGSPVLKELTLKGGPNNETLSLRQSADSDGVEYSYSTFLITAPYKRMVSETVSSSLSGFTYLIASEAVVLHPTAADKAKYGFNDPYAVLDITLAVQTTEDSDEGSSEGSNKTKIIYYNSVQSKITVGSKDEDGNYYVMIDDHDAIYLVAGSSLSVAVERTYVNTITELLFLKTITDLRQGSITTDGKTYDFRPTHDETKEDADKQMIVTCDEKTLNTQDFRTLYSQMMGIARYGETDQNPTGQPLHKIALYETDGSLYLSMDIFEYSSSLNIIRTNEGERFTVKTSNVSKYMAQIKAYLEGNPIADI